MPDLVDRMLAAAAMITPSRVISGWSKRADANYGRCSLNGRAALQRPSPTVAGYESDL